MAIVVYMFHAIGDIVDDDWADPHYGYDYDKFCDFLSKLGNVQSLKNARSENVITVPIVTFDDGHISNYLAAKYMVDNKLGTADFFINPEKVGTPYYMTWEHIQQLNDWGMSIQSHGLDHQYLSDCDDTELHRQLLKSKTMIEDRIDTKVTILAPPGGRYDKRVISLSKQLGYQVITNSNPGQLASTKQFLVPRMAVLQGYTVVNLLSFLEPKSALTIKIKTKHIILLVVKKILGNKQYDKLRWLVLGDR